MRTLLSISLMVGATIAAVGAWQGRADAQPAAPSAEPAAAPAVATEPGAAAEPAAVEPPPTGAPPTTPPAETTSATPLGLKHTCMAAINADQAWTDELLAFAQTKLRYDAHNDEAKLIALNKRHVILAYAVIWLLSVGFLIAMWRRQQALRGQLESLRRELDAAIKGSST
ncbi:MAG: hypothetical protein R3B48_00495 [Kofleriaceae bacterium]